jgi:hypothetical protein
MTNKTLLQFLMNQARRVEGQDGHWQLMVDGVPIICMTDEEADRMRFMSPIGRINVQDPGLLLRVLQANFHSALDARLAVQEGVLWSVFLSPLRPLTEELAANGFRQVTTLARNAADGDYHSGPWEFVGEK